MTLRRATLALLGVFVAGASVVAKTIEIDAAMHHLRAGDQREWSDFPARAEGRNLSIRFKSARNDAEWTLRLRQQDVKQTWKVLLNGKELGKLVSDENDQIIYFRIPVYGLMAGESLLEIEQVGRIPDDIRVGEIRLDDRPRESVLKEAVVELSVVEAGQKGDAAPMPCRLTILNAQGALATVGTVSDSHLAVRAGVVYSGDGKPRIELPAGDYTIHAGRGFEYGIDTVRVSVRPGELVRKTLSIRREVPTPGYVSCDTHVHTLTYSGHGDASVAERVLTLAGEGIELPIATDHNRQVDYRDAAIKQGVGKDFTLVTGNEVTTAVGHFNIWPVRAGGPVPDAAAKDWKSLFAGIAERTRAKVVILNHPCDLHSGFRPFGPRHHLALTGERLDGWELRANGMEVVNSGAQQTDVMRPYRDWFGLLNRGVFLTPVGASDSHDVSRFIVGQGRTYIRCRDDRPGDINVSAAAESFAAGRVLVGCGLLADITVNDKYGPGDLVPARGEIKVAVRVLGPSWAVADKVELYANGNKVREARRPDGKKAGVKWKGEWTLPRFRHDAHLVVVASGPGVRELYWPIARPYQPTSPVVHRRAIGSTGPVWIDADRDGERTSAFAYARRLLREAKGEWPAVVRALSDYDEAVAVQAASLLQARGISPGAAEVREAARKAGPQVERGFQAFTEAWRESQVARGEAR
ncbi:MAG TPA: CehA/McbA family metallohydrolase [Gemmataceae bacterium]|jgi:hypothetical protein